MGSRSGAFEGGSLRLYRESLAGVHALDRDVERGEEFKVDGLRVDKLPAGKTYSLQTRRPL